MISVSPLFIMLIFWYLHHTRDAHEKKMADHLVATCDKYNDVATKYNALVTNNNAKYDALFSKYTALVTKYDALVTSMEQHTPSSNAPAMQEEVGTQMVTEAINWTLPRDH